ncbi:MAG: efflux RND transporter periplasmic adaptor subunit [Rhodothalassiaceae bacterium]
MTPKLFKRAIAAGLVLLVAALVALALRPEPVAVDVAAAEIGPLVGTIDEEGETRVRDVYEVSAPTSGRLLRLDLDVGDRVEAGTTLLARLQPSDPTILDVRTEAELRAQKQTAEAQLALALADVQRAAAERDFAKSELDRAQELSQQGNVSEAAVDRARMAFNTSIAAFHRAEAAVAVARSELARVEAALMAPGEPDDDDPDRFFVDLVAPVTGQVLRIRQESEAVVVAGQTILEVGDPRDLEVVADLLSTEAVRVEEGAPVVISGWGGPDLRGRVRRVEPFGFTKVSALGVEEQRVNAIIDFVGPREQWQALGHGFRVDVLIEEWRIEEALSVPISALFRAGEDWALFAVADGRARLTPVSVGRFGAQRAELEQGLAPGTRVIVHPGGSIEDGTAVTVRPQSLNTSR